MLLHCCVLDMHHPQQLVQEVEKRTGTAQEGADPTKAPPRGTPGAPEPTNGHAAPAGEHAAPDTAAEGGPEGATEGTARRGVAPGSFLDLLMRATDRTTDRGFTDTEIANQARSSARPVH